ncbi:MAG TPA: hypothetical protein EYO59_10895, partial [Chromatiaceae bacterium]|nr:hypothetical protein [Chromatiaceae bacterium]
NCTTLDTQLDGTQTRFCTDNQWDAWSTCHSSHIRENYIIVTSQDIAQHSQELQNFIEHKNSRGYNTQLFVETAWLDENESGDAAAEALRRFLKDMNEEEPIKYLLIIGDPRIDTTPVPMKNLFPRNQNAVGISPHETEIICDFAAEAVPSDYMYALLSGNTDKDNDGKHAEFGQHDAATGPTGDFGPGGIDLNYKAIVGRIPVYGTYPNTLFNDSIESLDKILLKTMTYQNATYEKHLSRLSALIAAEGENRIFFGEAVANDIFKKNQIDPIYRVYDTENCWYNQSCPVVLPEEPDAHICSVGNVLVGWQNNLPGIVTWLTHGSGAGAAAVMNSYSAQILDDDYPVITFQASCYNSRPSTTNNLSYALLKNGAIGTVGATAISHGPGSTVDLQDSAHFAGNAGMAYYFMKHILEDRMTNGEALVYLKMNNTLYGRCWYWQNYVGFNLYGDPEISIYDYQATVSE